MSDAIRSVLTTAGLSRSFTQGEVTVEVLRGIDVAIAPGEVVALLGPSGSGKSTLLQALGLLEGGFEGDIRIADMNVSRSSSSERTRVRRDLLAFVYQFHHLLPDFDATENVMMPLLVRSVPRDEARACATAMLAALGLAHRVAHRPCQLSGGEQQRVAVARALVGRPLLILADEPTGNLDERTADLVLEQFLRLVRQQASAVLMATHNERLAARADRMIRLQEGVLA